jgi:class 3 adenylate cyclase
MPLRDDLNAEVKKIFKTAWTTRAGHVVPDPDDLALGNEAVEFERATVLYADLNGSTRMVDKKRWEFSAEVYKAFLHCAGKVIRQEGGEITAYDGDRIMGIFIGDHQSTRAARAGLKIHWATNNVVQPSLMEKYTNSDFIIRHVVGIDTSKIRTARTGVRGDNDLVWVGQAANYAAKLTELSHLSESTFITAAVFEKLADDAKYSSTDKELMWKPYNWTQMNAQRIYGSTWSWKI